MVDWGSGTTGKLELFIISKNGCRVGPRLLNVTLAAAPAKPEITGNDTVCLNSTSTFSFSAGPGITYQWTVFGGNILGNSDQPALNVRWNTQGRGWLTLTLSNAQG